MISENTRIFETIINDFDKSLSAWINLNGVMPVYKKEAKFSVGTQNINIKVEGVATKVISEIPGLTIMSADPEVMVLLKNNNGVKELQSATFKCTVVVIGSSELKLAMERLIKDKGIINVNQ